MLTAAGPWLKWRGHTLPPMTEPAPAAANLADLNRTFSAGGAVRFDAGPNGLTRATLTNDFGTAEVFLHGAHVTAWTPRGQAPVIFLSSKSHFANDKAIRGGVPICFPWFGPHAEPERKLPMHGFARLRTWTPLSASRGNDGAVFLVLGLASDDATLAWYPHDFRAIYVVRLGQQLELALTVENPGAVPLTAAAALHTYLHIGDPRRLAIHGLGGCPYVDKARNYGRFVQDEAVLRMTSYIDRVYTGTNATVTVDDPALSRRLIIAKDGSQSTVVWNPWTPNTFTDMAPDEWTQMLCVEAGAIAEHSLVIAPKASARLATTISVAPLP